MLDVFLVKLDHFPFLVTFKIRHLVQKLAFFPISFMFSNSRVVLDGPCDDDFDDL